MSSVTPAVGDWYKNEAGAEFEIVAIDEDEGAIEIQFFDGTIEEIDVDSWDEQEFTGIEPPEDWSGSLDIEREDYGVDLESSSHLEHNSPLDELET
jgi:hypothetical protein